MGILTDKIVIEQALTLHHVQQAVRQGSVRAWTKL